MDRGACVSVPRKCAQTTCLEEWLDGQNKTGLPKEARFNNQKTEAA